ncbi:MAG TPA: SDR family oxidoreductase [Saccharospirillum sp.]|nr:SDR family oxidoreductase [Saccharospirillum sp.]
MTDIYPLAITGASGQLGRLVISSLLTEQGVPADQIIALTRHPEKLKELADQGIQVRQADFDDPASLKTAFEGVNRLLLISTDELVESGKRLAQHKLAVSAAEQAGVRHMLYTSMPKPEGSAITFAGDHLKTEQFIAESSLSWTILRNSWYFENLLMETGHILESGQWFTAAGDGRVANIARADLAAAAAAALASHDYSNRTYTLTGKEAHTTAQMATLLSDVSGRSVVVVPITDEQKVAGLEQAGLPPVLAKIFASFDTNTRQGGVAEVTNDFNELTGREPMTLKDWLNQYRALFTTAS